ncbi:MAG TPA: YdjY domain-containing protein [Gemmataceae bacterium]|nr:YdjY domain-containing protein [Gemmataceae bacterium]
MSPRKLSLAVLVGASAACITLGDQAKTGIVVDKDKRTVTIDAKIAPRIINDPRYKREDGKPYPIEVIACYPFPKGQKAHETVVTIDVKPSEVHKALERLGLKAGKPAIGESKEAAQGPEVKIYLEVPAEEGKRKRLPIERVLIDPKTNKTMPKVQWRFTGSGMKQPDPDKDEKVYGADLTGTLISIFPVTNETVFQTNLTMKEEKYVKLETNAKLLPKVGTTVKLILEIPAKN